PLDETGDTESRAILRDGLHPSRRPVGLVRAFRCASDALERLAAATSSEDLRVLDPLELELRILQLDELKGLLMSNMGTIKSGLGAETYLVKSLEEDLLFVEDSRERLGMVLRLRKDAEDALDGFRRWVRERERERDDIPCLRPSVARLPLTLDKLRELQRKLNCEEPPVGICGEKLERVRERTSPESAANLFAEFAFYESIQRSLAGAVEVWLARLSGVQERLSAFDDMCQEMHASVAECERVLDSGEASSYALFRVKGIVIHLLQEWKNRLEGWPLKEAKEEMHGIAEWVCFRDGRSLQQRLSGLLARRNLVLDRLQASSSQRYIRLLVCISLSIFLLFALMHGAMEFEAPGCEDTNHTRCLRSNNLAASFQPVLVYVQGSPPV
ncbi:unnamed protein product, partial [Darwinula stevensoni]